MYSPICNFEVSHYAFRGFKFKMNKCDVTSWKIILFIKKGDNIG